MSASGRRTQVEALDDLTAQVRLSNQLTALALPVAALRHDAKKYTDPAAQARADEKNRKRAEVRAALGWDNA